jgi:hypothetical protein
MPVNSTPVEWYECLSRGTAAVRHTYDLSEFRRNGIVQLSVFHIRSFSDCFGWTVYRIPEPVKAVEIERPEQRKYQYKLQSVVWRQAEDLERLQQHTRGKLVPSAGLATPTLEENFCDFDAERFERELNSLARIRIPLTLNRPIGCDGESYGVHVRDHFDLEWWCEGPQEWRELVLWTNRWIEFVRRYGKSQ